LEALAVKMDKETTVLIVVEDRSILKMFTRLLQKNGYAVESAETGRQAIEKVKKASFRVILVDFELPDMDAPALLLSIQGSMSTSAIIVVSSSPSFEGGLKAFDAGADAYLVKPIKPEDLLLVIKEKLEKHRKNF
jgi:DNA-binding response OmpR family regulator